MSSRPVPTPPAEEVEFEDALEEAWFEAAVCGDVGFADRMAGCWWPELDGPVPPWLAEGTPADPLESIGPAAWMRHAARERNQSDARFLAAIHVGSHHQAHLSGCRDEQGRPPRDASAAAEVATAHGWSTAMATWWIGLAETAVDRVPALHTAMAEGWLGLEKTKALAAATRAMPSELARRAVAAVLESAPHIATGDLAERVTVAAIQLDADWVRRREQAARAEVRLEATRTPEGTVDLALRDVDAESGARIRARIEALAHDLRTAARAAGVRVGVGVARALIAQRLWDGSTSGLDDDTLIARLVRELPAWLESIDPAGGDRAENDGPDDDGPSDGAGVRAGTVELRMRLSTALGLDDLPAHLVTAGTLAAGSARSMLETTCRGAIPVECRLVLTDPDGRLEHVLLVAPARPVGPRPARGLVIVELAAPTTFVANLNPDDHPPWARWLRRARRRLGGLPDRAADLGGALHPAHSTADARRRFAGRELERFVRVRDRHCVGPLCRGAAHRAEIDHTRDRQHGGPTIAGNLGPLCRHCHHLKHDRGWHLTQPEPGRFEWTSPLGSTRTVTPRRVLDPTLDPAPPSVQGHRATPPRRARPTWDAEKRPRQHVAATVPPAPPRTPAPARRSDPDDDVPPF